MKRTLSVALVLSTGLLASVVEAGDISASAVISAIPDGSNFDYTIELTNTSSGPNADPIGTFWFAWVPGKDFLPTEPIAVTPPSGWKDVITGGGAGDGFAIQFEAIAPTNALAPGGMLAFQFESADTPAQIAGDSPTQPTFPVLTSVVYAGKPFVSDSQQFQVSSLPEPSSWILGLAGAISAIGYVRLKNRSIVA